MPEARCSSCNKTYRVPEYGKKYRCKCGALVEADEAPVKPPAEGVRRKKSPGPAPSTKRVGGRKAAPKPPSSSRPVRRAHRSSSRGRKTLNRTITAIIVMAAAAIVVFFIYSATKSDSLVEAAESYAATWNKTRGMSDEEGMEKVLAFFWPETREVWASRVPSFLRRNGYITRVPQLKDPSLSDDFSEAERSGASVDFTIQLDDDTFVLPTYWKRDRGEEWRIFDFNPPRDISDLTSLSRRFMESWNDLAGESDASSLLALFALKHDRPELEGQLAGLIKGNGWRDNLPDLGSPGKSERARREFGTCRGIEYAVTGPGPCRQLDLYWMQRGGKWFLREVAGGSAAAGGAASLSGEAVRSEKTAAPREVKPLALPTLLRQKLEIGDQLTYRFFNGILADQVARPGKFESRCEVEIELIVQLIMDDQALCEARLIRMKGMAPDLFDKGTVDYDSKIDIQEWEKVDRFFRFLQSKTFLMAIGDRGDLIGANGYVELVADGREKASELCAEPPAAAADKREERKSKAAKKNADRRIRKMMDHFSSMLNTIVWAYPRLPAEMVSTGSEWKEEDDLLQPDSSQRHLTARYKLGSVEDGLLKLKLTGTLNEKNDLPRPEYLPVFDKGQLVGRMSFDPSGSLIKKKSLECSVTTRISDVKRTAVHSQSIELVGFKRG